MELVTQITTIGSFVLLGTLTTLFYFLSRRLNEHHSDLVSRLEQENEKLHTSLEQFSKNFHPLHSTILEVIEQEARLLIELKTQLGDNFEKHLEQEVRLNQGMEILAHEVDRLRQSLEESIKF